MVPVTTQETLAYLKENASPGTTSRDGPSSDGLRGVVPPEPADVSKDLLPTVNPTDTASNEKLMKRNDPCRGSTKLEAISSILSFDQTEHENNAQSIDDVIPSTFQPAGNKFHNSGRRKDDK